LENGLQTNKAFVSFFFFFLFLFFSSPSQILTGAHVSTMLDRAESRVKKSIGFLSCDGGREQL
jgi:hypothetical protein